LNGSRVLMVGVAYKKDIDDYRESPALKVSEEFQKNGAIVDFYDPYIPSYKYKEKIYHGLKAIDEAIVESYDIVVITTNHTKVDYDMIARSAKAVFDTKNAMECIVENREYIELL